MTLKTSLIIGLAVAALVVGVQAASAQSPSDASDRAKLDTAAPSGAFQRTPGEKQLLAGLARLYGDAHERAAARTGSQPSSFVSPDTLDGARGVSVLADSHERINPGTAPVSGTAAGTGRDVEWPQVGIAFGLGIALALGLLLVIRATRIRPLAH
jgi:hypothetical protein